MFIQVRLLQGFNQLLWYQVPEQLSNNNLLGSVVQVPLRGRIIPALVEKTCLEKPKVSFTIRAITSIDALPADRHYHKFIQELAHYYQVASVELIRRMRGFLKHKESAPEYYPQQLSSSATDAVVLTAEQQKVVDFIVPRIVNNTYTPTLLHGITGSGKTEVYKKCIEHARAHGKSTILLLPEVTLAVQFTQIMRQQLSQAQHVYSFHSATGAQEKRLLWSALHQQQAIVIIGVHLPILLPSANLGLIIIDEEHEIGFQEKKYPKINSKEAAIMRARCYNIPILLGSATPSIASLHAVQTKKWYFFQLKQRFAGALPQVQLVVLENRTKRSNFWISKPLEDALRDRLKHKQQSIIFLNRRGYSFFMQCDNCKFVWYCDSCSVSLTLHNTNQLVCHYCAYTTVVPACCPTCKQPSDTFLKKGIGTQQLVAILQKILPIARITRADLDSTVDKKKWRATVKAFQEGNIDILVGTQTITKGYHFPNVTLVGVVWADVNLHLPFYNASETTVQQLIQVAGRAGRAHAHSTVIVQTMMHYPMLDFLDESTYMQFYFSELEKRAEVGYPPCFRLADVTIKNADEHILAREAEQIAGALRDYISKHAISVTVLGPALPPVYKVNNIFVRKLYLKSASMDLIIQAIQSINSASLWQSSVVFTPNPLAP